PGVPPILPQVAAYSHYGEPRRVRVGCSQFYAAAHCALALPKALGHCLVYYYDRRSQTAIKSRKWVSFEHRAMPRIEESFADNLRISNERFFWRQRRSACYRERSLLVVDIAGGDVAGR